MRALVTGIAGFAGRHLSAELIDAGYEVHGIDLGDGRAPPDVASVRVADLTDAEAARRAFGEVRPGVVFHLAGAASVGQSFENPIGTWRVNLDGTLSVLEALRAEAPAAPCVVVTSGEIHGRVAQAELPVGPGSPFRPHSPYAASKAAADVAAGQYHDGFGLPVLRVRAFNHIGPGQDPRFVVPAVARQIALGERDGRERIEIRLGNLESRRDFTDVRDVVRAYRLVAERGDPATPYLVCSGRSVSVRELVEGLAILARAEVVITSQATLQREGEPSDLYGSPDRLTADTGWAPEIPLEVSLRDSLDWWRARVAEED